MGKKVMLNANTTHFNLIIPFQWEFQYQPVVHGTEIQQCNSSSKKSKGDLTVMCTKE